MKRRLGCPFGDKNPSYDVPAENGGLAANIRNLPKNDHPANLGGDHIKSTGRGHTFDKKNFGSILAIFDDFFKGGVQGCDLQKKAYFHG